MSSLNLLEGVILAACTGLAGFASATFLERIKKPYAHELAKLSTRIQALDEQQIKREYELYEVVYAQVFETYHAFVRAKAMDEPIGALEEADLKAIQALSPDEASPPGNAMDARKRALEDAFDKLRTNIHIKRPFLPREIFLALEDFWLMAQEAYFSRAYPDLYKPPFEGPKYRCNNGDIKRQMDVISDKISERLDVERHLLG